MSEDRYKQAYAFMEGWLNIHFKKSPVLTKADRINLLKRVHEHYSILPVGSELKEAVLNIRLEAENA